jgi:hypothetical protein
MHCSSVTLRTTVSSYYPTFVAQILMKCQREIVAVFYYDLLLYTIALQGHFETIISLNMHAMNLISSEKTATRILDIKLDTTTICNLQCAPFIEHIQDVTGWLSLPI